MSSLSTSKIADATVTTIGYGAMGIGGIAYGEADSDEERFKVLDRLYELGERNIDTASAYGDSEELIGKWLKRNPTYRDSLFIATKFGFAPDYSIRGDRDFVRQSTKESLEKLGIETIDLLYQHRPDKNTPIEITVRAMAELVKEGRVKYLGLSECSVDTIRRAQKIHPIAAVQIEYSPIELLHEHKGGVIDVCKELGIAVVAYSPTGRGILTGRYHGPEDFEKGDFRSTLPKFSKENFPKVLKVVSGLKEIGASKQSAFSAAQVAIAWVKAQGTVVIPGAKQIKYVEENVHADALELSEEEIKKIRGWAEELDWTNKGARYPPGLEELSGLDTPPLNE